MATRSFSKIKALEFKEEVFYWSPFLHIKGEVRGI